MFTLPELPYSIDSLEPFFDKETMQIHHDKHHAAYVKNLNDLLNGSEFISWPVEQLISQIDKIPEDIRQKVLNNAGGHINHSFFWKILKFSGTPNPAILALKDEFNKTALSIFGSGWVWISIINNQLTISNTTNQDMPKGKIVLGLDVWEHAYYLKYQNRRAEYIEAFWNIINWDAVNRNLV